MSVNLSINQLLKVDAIELLKGLPFSPPDSRLRDRGTTEDFNRVYELPDFSADDFLEWRGTPAINIREIREVNVDLLAWYQPFSNFGDEEWGIYFDIAKINEHALKIYQVAKSVRPQINPSTVVRIVWDEVMRHEREHVVQELILAVLVQLGIHPPMDLNAVYSASNGAFEALATHYEHVDAVYRQQNRDVIDSNFVRHITSRIQKPSGYSDWDDSDLDVAIKKAFGSLIESDITLIVALRLRKVVRWVIGNSFVKVPIYLK